MKVSLNWLSEYVDLPDVSPEELAERLTLAGLEAEGMEPLWAEGALVAQVEGIEPHPHAQNLSVCHLHHGSGSATVVCGAGNVVEGGLVPYAPPGATVQGTVVKEATIRGVKSSGMILSRQELGLEAKSPRIWELPPGTPQGADLAKLIELPDVILSLKITSNRPDLLGIYGIAREIAALYSTDLRDLEVSFPEGGPEARELTAVEIESGEDCPRYVARLILGVEEQPSPLLLEARLLKAGMRPLSLVVDATNYAMLELGHPLHAFDQGKLAEGRIVVRRARPGERIRTLDGVERELSPEVLVIADGARPVAVAGVMGGEETEVGVGTKAVLLEAACFSPARVRRSARALGARTEASLRFERGLSPEMAELASRRCCALLCQFALVKIARGAVDAYPLPRPAPVLTLRRTRVKEILGIEVPAAQIEGGLTRLGLRVKERGERWGVEVPPFRGDLTREIDLIEEIARLYGYDRISSQPPKVEPRLGGKDPGEAFADRVREILAGLGLSEAYTFPLVPRAEAGVTLRNPMAQGQEGLRRNLLPGLLWAAGENFRAQAQGVALFEVGRVFRRGEDGVCEEDHAGILLAGRALIPLSGKGEYGPTDLKGILDALLKALRLEAGLGPCENPDLHPARRASVLVDGRPVGWLGEVAAERTRGLLGERRGFAAEVALPALREASRAPAYRALPRYPASKRDLSLLVPRSVAHDQVLAAIRAEPLVETSFLYDLYQGPGIPEDHISLTYEVAFRHPERTLASEEVEAAVAGILKGLSPLGVRLRT